MGNDGERLVMDYLSKVGDLAHGASISAVERRQLITRVRDEIGEQRSAVQSPERTGDVKRILRQMGSPEDVVAAAGGTEPSNPAPVPSSTPAAESGTAPGLRGLFRKRSGGSGPSDEPLPSAGPEQPAVPDGAAMPGPRADPGGDNDTGPGADAGPGAETGPAERTEPAAPEPPAGHGGPREDWPDGRIGGFVGGILDPDMLRPPPADAPTGASTGAETKAQAAPGTAEVGAPEAASPLAKEPGAAGAATPGQTATGPATADQAPAGTKPGESGPVPPIAPPQERGAAARRGLRRVGRSIGGKHVGGFVEITAVLTLVAGAVMPSLYLMVAGWLLAFWAPRMSRRMAKATVFAMPGLVVGSYVTWLFGRVNEYWGEPLEGEALRSALVDNYATLLQLSAVASAAFLLWRAARRP